MADEDIQSTGDEQPSDDTVTEPVEDAPVPEVAEEPAPDIDPAAEEPAPDIDPAAEEPAAEAADEPTPEPAEIEPVAASDSAPEAATETTSVVPWWPFLGYLVMWVVYGAGLVWMLRGVDAALSVTEAPVYPSLLLVGIVLAVSGPAIALITWLVVRAHSEREGLSLFAAIALRGSLATLAGTMIWWASLMVLDFLRLGRVW